jgi:hypothetical protein
MSDASNTWYVRDRFDEVRGRWVVRAFRGPRYPDGVVVGEEDPDLDGAEPLWMVTGDGKRRSIVAVSERIVPSASTATLWFVELSERPDLPDEAQLVAFASDHLPPGTVIDRFAFAGLGVANEDQVGAVKWRPSSGVVAEIFIRPSERRQQLATLILYAASAVHQSHGWPGALRSDGRRTDLGERFVTGLAHPQRIAPWTERAGPMDVPGAVTDTTDDAAGSADLTGGPAAAVAQDGPTASGRRRWFGRRTR